MKLDLAALAGLVCAALGLSAPPTPAGAAALRTWVSSVGNDSSLCTRAQPCRTFAGALNATAIGGEVNCLDSGSFGAVVITQSVTIDCHGAFGSIVNAHAVGIVVNFNMFPNLDKQKAVRLRDLNVNGLATGIVGIQIIGGTSSAGSSVVIEDCILDGNNPNTGLGISDTRRGGSLLISNTTVRNMPGGAGITVAPASGSAGLQVSLDNVKVLNSFFGLVIGNGVTARVDRSVFSGNPSGALEAGAGSVLTVDRSIISFNGTAILPNGGSIQIANSDVAFNYAAVSGSVASFTNSRLSGNSTLGGTVTPIGGPSSDTGEQ